MKILPQTFQTKLGASFQIREARVSDSLSLIECVKSYLKSGLIPITLFEYEKMITDHETWIRKFIEGKNDLLLVAEYEGEIIGNIDLTIHSLSMLRHTGYLGMGVHENWQNQGIGKLLLQKILTWADGNSEIEIVWLQVFGNNLGGIKLYQHSGFIQTGVQKKFIKTSEGRYIDNVIMTRDCS